MPPKCSFCDRDASFGPYEAARVCDVCVTRIAAIANQGGGRTADRVWYGVWSGVAPPSKPTPQSSRVHARDEGERVAVDANAGADVDEVFARFKEGVAKQISAEDAESHLNLAIAYTEMALYRDAVREAGVVLEGTRDTKLLHRALSLLLTAPLLRKGGLRALHHQLTTHQAWLN